MSEITSRLLLLGQDPEPTWKVSQRVYQLGEETLFDARRGTSTAVGRKRLQSNERDDSEEQDEQGASSRDRQENKEMIIVCQF